LPNVKRLTIVIVKMMSAINFCSPHSFKQARNVALIAILCMKAGALPAQASGSYTIHADQPQQVIKGLGFEIQSDSIGSGNAGMPDEVIAVPHDLTPSEKIRFYTEMLHGFRYARLAMGLYLRGNDAEKKQIVERYSGQMDDLRTMQQISGLEGFDVEYWSPAPYWKANKTYYGGTIAGSDPAFVNVFTDALAEDLRYLQGHGLRIAQWGLQNEPAIGHLQQTPGTGRSGDANQSYSNCSYSPALYATVLSAAVPKIRAVAPGVQIQAPSWDGPAGPYAAEIRKDPELLKNIDAWTWHQIGHNSNDQILLRDKYLLGADGKPVYENEFEYQPWDKSVTVDDYFMNTGQSLMNWMVFENSPVWYWIHALKPVTNMEATGYALGYWRSTGELKQNIRSNLEPGHWEFNPHIWNAIAGFLKYMPWDSTRLNVEESTVLNDQRVLVWRSKTGKLGIALSNRGSVPFTFHLSGTQKVVLVGHRYTVATLDISLGRRSVGKDISITVPPHSFEFWITR
jgi:O-glycosyl hydrolase